MYHGFESLAGLYDDLWDSHVSQDQRALKKDFRSVTHQEKLKRNDRGLPVVIGASQDLLARSHISTILETSTLHFKGKA
jgi:hypothetical protein